MGRAPYKPVKEGNWHSFEGQESAIYYVACPIYVCIVLF